MTDLPRYSMQWNRVREEAFHVERPDGDWVKWTDVSARLQQLEAEKASLELRYDVVMKGRDILATELADSRAALAETRDAIHQIVEGFKSEAINGVICTPPPIDIGNDDSVGNWNAEPNRTWCARCKARWHKLFDLAAKLAPVKDQAP